MSARMQIAGRREHGGHGGSRGRVSRRGFTLVELLVVMAIISVLVALLLPAIQSVRESARVTTCRNHVGQLAKAMMHFEAAQQKFPSGGWGDVWLGVAERGGGIQQPGGWTFSILPYLDEETVLDKVAGMSSGDAAARYQDLASSPLPVFACPSRRTSRPLATAGESYRGAFDSSFSLPVATRSDYAANAGTSASCPPLEIYKSIASDPLVSGKSIQICHQTGGGGGTTLTVSISAMFGPGGHGNHSGDHVGVCSQCSDPVVVASPGSLSQGDGWTGDSLAAKVNRADGGLPDLQDGIVFRMSGLAAAAIRDGMANTYLVGEKAVAADRYGAGTDAGDTAPLFVGYSDDNLRWAYDTPDRDLPGVSRPQAFGAPHFGGVTMALADGSVRTIPFEIDPAVHKALAGRNDRIIAAPP